MSYDPAVIFEHSERKKYSHFLRNYSKNGKHHRHDLYKTLIPTFRDYYFKQRMTGITDYTDIIIGFQNAVKPKEFYPYPTAYRKWIENWEKAIVKAQTEREKCNIVETADVERSRMTTDKMIQDGANKLSLLLMNNAQLTLENAALEEDQLGKRSIAGKKLAVSVLSGLTKLTQGNRSLELKEKANDRDNIGFFMNLIREAKAGKLTEETLELLTQPNEKI